MKKGEIPVFQDTYLTGADLSAKRYYAVKLNTAGDIVLAGAGESAIGILQTPEAQGRPATVMELGLSFAVLGANVDNAGVNLTPDANGKLVTAGPTDAVVASTVQASGKADEIVPVNLVIRSSGGTTGIAKSYTYLQFPVTLSAADNADIVTDFVPGFVGKIVGVHYVAQVAATTADKTADISLEIGTTAVTGGVVSLTTEAAGTVGKVTDGSAITAENVLAADSKISIVAANTAAPFIEGSGTIVVKIEI